MNVLFAIANLVDSPKIAVLAATPATAIAHYGYT